MKRALKFILVVLAIAFLLTSYGCVSPREGGAEGLLSVHEVKQLCLKREEARTVRFRGVVTAVDHRVIVVQAGQAGVRVEVGGLIPPALTTSHLVEVTGITPAGAGEDSIVDGKITDLGPSQLPVPVTLPTRLDLDGLRVTISGVLEWGRHNGGAVYMLHTPTGPVELVFDAQNSSEMERLDDAEIAVTGVARSTLNVDGKVTGYTLQVLSPELTRVLRAARDLRSAAPIRASDVMALHSPLPLNRVKLHGSILADHDSLELRFADDSGTIPIHVGEGQDIMRPSVDIAAFVVREDGDLTLDDAIILTPGAGSAPSAAPSARSNSESIRNAADLRALPAEKAILGKPVRIDGVITYRHREWGIMFVQDATSGVFVNAAHLTEAPGTSGDRVIVTGTTTPGDFAPTVLASRLQLLGASPYPKPSSLNQEEVFLGKADSQWVELEGIVQSVYMASGQPGAGLSFGAHSFQVGLPGGTPPVPKAWINALVRVRGVCGTLFNSKRQLRGIQLFVPSLDQFTIVESPGADVFQLPVAPINTLLRFSPQATIGHSVHIHGTVTASAPDGPTWVQDPTGGVMVRHHQEIVLRAGQIVEVMGFASPGTTSPEMDDAVVRLVSAGATPRPAWVTSEEAQSGSQDAQLVRIDGRLMDQFSDGRERVLVLQSGRKVFKARSVSGLPNFDPGAVLRLTGIYSAVTSQRLNGIVNGIRLPQQFDLILRSRDDVQVLRPAPFLTPQRTFRALGFAILVSVAVLVWVGVLRRRVAMQTQVIAQKLNEVKALKDTAESANRAKSDFLAQMSHEIRTPMNGIVGMTELSLDCSREPEVRDNLLIVKSSADALLTIINDILDFSKIEAGKLELEPIEFDLRDCMEETVRALAIRAHEKRLEVICDISAAVPRVIVGDPTRLRQIVTNLLGNAIKFTEKGEVSLRVWVEESVDDKILVHFTVEDTGIGVPREKQQMIFTAFTQADASTTRKFGGTGLGLTICSRLVAMMGGRIWVESEGGSGSKFHFTGRLRSGANTELQNPPSLSGTLSGVSVLIVDDNATNRRVLGEIVSQWGMNPATASGGEEALGMLERAANAGTPISLVLCDVHMPGMDGFMVSERILKDPVLRQSRVILLTSGAQPGDSARCRNLGIAGYLTKPIRQSELRTAALAVYAQSAEGEPRPSTAKHTEHNSSTPLRALVAEDNLVNQIVIRRTLERQGCDVTVVATGVQAVAALETQSFDVVFMDVQMPEMDGFEATQEVRRREAGTGRHHLIIAMTAHAMKGDRERCLSSGMDDYLAKPVRPNEVAAILERIASPDQSSPPSSPCTCSLPGHSSSPDSSSAI